jgi:hypothetical protein
VCVTGTKIVIDVLISFEYHGGLFEQINNKRWNEISK